MQEGASGFWEPISAFLHSFLQKEPALVILSGAHAARDAKDLWISF